MSDALTVQIGGTHLCHHGIMAIMCQICPAEKERDTARAEIAALKHENDVLVGNEADSRRELDTEKRMAQKYWDKMQAARAEIAALTKERDELQKAFDIAREWPDRLIAERDAMKAVVEAAQEWGRDRHDAMTSAFYPSETRLFNAVVGFNSLAALATESAAQGTE